MAAKTCDAQAPILCGAVFACSLYMPSNWYCKSPLRCLLLLQGKCYVRRCTCRGWCRGRRSEHVQCRHNHPWPNYTASKNSIQLEPSSSTFSDRSIFRTKITYKSGRNPFPFCLCTSVSWEYIALHQLYQFDSWLKQANPCAHSSLQNTPQNDGEALKGPGQHWVTVL